MVGGFEGGGGGVRFSQFSSIIYGRQKDVGVWGRSKYQSLLQPLPFHDRFRFRFFVTCGCKASELQFFLLVPLCSNILRLKVDSACGGLAWSENLHWLGKRGKTCAPAHDMQPTQIAVLLVTSRANLWLS